MQKDDQNGDLMVCIKEKEIEILNIYILFSMFACICHACDC